jgi:hypothetical protein
LTSPDFRQPGGDLGVLGASGWLLQPEQIVHLVVGAIGLLRRTASTMRLKLVNFSILCVLLNFQFPSIKLSSMPERQNSCTAGRRPRTVDATSRPVRCISMPAI